MSNNCGCNGEHDHDHECQCGNDDHECGCNHDHEVPTMNITLEDGTEMVCMVVGTYDIDESSYIALVEEDDDQVMIYKFEESEGEESEEGKSIIDLINIESDEEFELASEAFYELFVAEGEEDEE